MTDNDNLSKPDIPGYKVGERIGKGGMGKVYLATEENFHNRTVALKILSQEGHKNEIQLKIEKYFKNEIEILAKLKSHPNIIQILDHGDENGVSFFTMIYMEGGTLDRHIKEGLTIEKTLKITERLIDALDHLHKNNIIHRDIKPQNILFYPDGTPVLSDFGIAKALGGSEERTISTELGSRNYMSPEQRSGSGVDHRTDYYALGKLILKMLTGKVPSDNDTNLPPELKCFQYLVNSLLEELPENRPSNSESLQKIFQEAKDNYSNKVNDTVIVDKNKPSATSTTLKPLTGLANFLVKFFLLVSIVVLVSIIDNLIYSYRNNDTIKSAPPLKPESSRASEENSNLNNQPTGQPTTQKELLGETSGTASSEITDESISLSVEQNLSEEISKLIDQDKPDQAQEILNESLRKSPNDKPLIDLGFFED